MVDVAEIKIWGEPAGAVRWDQQQQLGYFQYDPKFLQKGWDLSPIKMPISGGSRIYSFPEFLKLKLIFPRSWPGSRKVRNLW